MPAMASLEPDARTRRGAAAAATPLALNFSGLEFASPIVLLSGCVGFGEEYTRIEGFSNRDAGAIVRASFRTCDDQIRIKRASP